MLLYNIVMWDAAWHQFLFSSILQYMDTLCQTLNHFNILLYYIMSMIKAQSHLGWLVFCLDFTEIFVPAVAQQQ